jgi:hypothetical protein
MSAATETASTPPLDGAPRVESKPQPQEGAKNYKGFVAGVFSGVGKLSGKFAIYSSGLVNPY